MADCRLYITSYDARYPPAARQPVTRVVSFLPAGTEIARAIGAGNSLVGRSHECDYPPQVRSLPVVRRPTLKL